MGIGERIKLIRGHERQDAFSVKVGVHLNTVGRWERGQRSPDVDDLNKILAAFPEINPTWLLTGVGEMRWSEGERQRLLFDGAHEQLRERIKGSISGGGWNVLTNIIPREQLRSYAFDKDYMPTTEELIELCRISCMDSYCSDQNIEYEDFISIITNQEFGRSSEAREVSIELDNDLLSLIYEVIEDIDSDSHVLSVQQKAELFSLVYQMNRGSKYTKDRLKRFIEAVCIFIEQGVDFNKLSDRKLSNIIIEIAHHVVKGGE